MSDHIMLLSDHKLKMSDKLLFTVPVSNAKLERILNKLKRVKINFRCSLGVKRLTNILRIMEEEGSSCETFDPMSIKEWSIDRVRRATEEIGSRSYKSHTSHPEVNVKSLNDDDSDDEEGNICENENEEGYLFSYDSE